MASLKSVAIAGASGTLGKHVLSAFLQPEFRSSFSEIIVLKRPSASSKSDVYQDREGATIRTYDDSNLTAALEGVDVLISTVGPQGHEFKEKLVRAIPESNVELYIPSEFGVDHDVHDFDHAEWDQKKHHVEVAKTVLTTTRMCRIFIGLFTEESIGPWFGFNTNKAEYEVVGSADSLVTYTALDDVGRAVASVARLPLEKIPDRIHIAGDTISSSTLARIMEDAGSSTIKIQERDIEAFKNKAMGSRSADPSQFLRFLMGEGKINHTTSGLGNDNNLVNPNEKFWKWKTMTDYAKETKGRPWADSQWNQDS